MEHRACMCKDEPMHNGRILQYVKAFFYLCLVGFVKGCFAVERKQGNTRPHMEKMCVPDTAFSHSASVQLEMITSEKPKNTENASEHMTAGREKRVLWQYSIVKPRRRFWASLYCDFLM